MFKFYLFGIFLILALTLRLALFSFSPAVKIPKGPVVFEAVLKQTPQLNGRGQVLSFANVKVYTDFETQYEVGERLKVEGAVDEKGRMYQPRVSKVSRVSGVSSAVASLRSRIADNISRLLPKKEAILVQGTILGVDNIDYGFRQELINTGTIHVVVVSGQNMAIAAGIFLAFAKYLGRRLAVVLALIGVLCYATLAGFQPPVIRAAIMVSAATIATLFGREIWPMWSLLLAAYAIVFINPASITEISFQLTFAATLGIMTLGRLFAKMAGPVSFFLPANARPKLKTSGNQKDNGELRVGGNPSKTATHAFFQAVGASAAVAVSAYLFTAPLIIFYFGRISLLAPLVNILVIEAVTPIMIIGFALALVSLVWMPAAQIVAILIFVPAFYFVKVVEIFSAIPYGQAEFGQGNILLLIVLYALVSALTIFIFRHSGERSDSRI
jgi:competence protein ComEC